MCVDKLRQALIVPGDLRAGNVYHPPVRTPVDDTLSLVRAPPENSREFQALADFPLALKSRMRIFNAPGSP